MNKKILITTCLMACVVGTIAEARKVATIGTEYTKPVGASQILDALTEIRPIDRTWRGALGLDGLGRILDAFHSFDDSDVKDAYFQKINSASHFSSYTGIEPNFSRTAMLFAFPTAGLNRTGPDIRYRGPSNTRVICGLMNAAGAILPPTYQVTTGVFTQVQLPSISGGAGASPYSAADIFGTAGVGATQASAAAYYMLCQGYQVVSGQVEPLPISPDTLEATWG